VIPALCWTACRCHEAAGHHLDRGGSKAHDSKAVNAVHRMESQLCMLNPEGEATEAPGLVMPQVARLTCGRSLEAVAVARGPEGCSAARRSGARTDPSPIGPTFPDDVLAPAMLHPSIMLTDVRMGDI